MEKPAWAKIIGAFMIIFGGCGVTQDVKQINSEALTTFSVDLANEISKELGDEELDENEKRVLIQLSNMDTIGESSDTILDVERLANTIKNITHMPPEVIDKMKLHGNIGLVISILYALAGLLLVIRREHVLKIVYGVLTLSLLFVIYQYFDTRNIAVSSLMGIGLDFNLYFGGFLDLILLTVLSLVDKSYFTEEVSAVDHYDGVDPI